MVESSKRDALPSADPRWRHLYYISEEINRLAAGAPGKNVQEMLHDFRIAIESAQEAFPKELDPAVDAEGFAIRRFIKSLITAMNSLEEKVGR